MQKVKLTDADWLEIWSALESKTFLINQGYYGKETEKGQDKKWIKHLKTIQKKIGDDGQNMYLKNQPPVRVLATVEGGVVQGAYSNDPGVVFDVWDWDDKDEEQTGRTMEIKRGKACRKWERVSKGLAIIY